MLILVIGLGFCALFFLLLLYFLCRSCSQQNQVDYGKRYKYVPSQSVQRSEQQTILRGSLRDTTSPSQSHNSYQQKFPQPNVHNTKRPNFLDGFEVENYESLQRRTLKPENRNFEIISYINEVKRLEVDEIGRMYAIFRKSDCHLLIKESRATRQNTNKKQTKRSRSGIR